MTLPTSDEAAYRLYRMWLARSRSLESHGSLIRADIAAAINAEAAPLRLEVERLRSGLREIIRNAEIESDDCDPHPMNLRKIAQEALNAGKEETK